MEPFPFISVLIVTWNGWHHLRECLPSILAQDYPKERMEILVVDNGSVDGTLENLRMMYPEIKLILNRENQGFALPNNIAAKEAKGEYLALINNDMRADSGWLREAVRCLDESSGRICVASRILSWDGTTIDFQGGTLQYLGYAQQVDQGKPTETAQDTQKDLLFPCGGAMLIHRRVFLDSGGFDPAYFAIYEDVDLGWRLWIEGHRVTFAPHSTVFHKFHGTLNKAREEKMRFLMHRNALFTIFKNYSADTLRRILPIAMVTAVRRALFFSGADRESFYLWAPQEAEMSANRHTPEYILWHSREAINHLVVLDDFFKALPDLWPKREEIQKRRLRPEEEIFSLFQDPFRAIVIDGSYEETELRLLESLDLEALFPQAGKKMDSRREDHLRLLQKQWDRLSRENLELEKRKRYLELQILELEDRVRQGPESSSAGSLKVPDRKSFSALFSEFRRHQHHSGWREAIRQTGRFINKRWRLPS